MPAREFLNPYAALTEPNVAAGGFANLAAALAAEPQDSAEIAQRQQEKHQRDIWQNRRLEQEDQRLGDEATNRAAGLAEERRYHDAETKARADDLEERKGANSERERHNKAGESTAATSAFLRGTAGIVKTVAGVAGYGAKKGATKDPAAASLTAYGHATTVAKTMHGADADPAQIKATADELYDTFQKQEGSQLLPRPQGQPGRTVTMPGGVQPAPSVGASWLRRSGQPGVHSFGDLMGGVVDGWSGPSDSRAPAPAPGPTAGAPAQVMPREVLLQKAAKAGITPEAAAAHYQQLGYQIGN